MTRPLPFTFHDFSLQGVMTSHDNIMSQLEAALDFMPAGPGDTAVSYLPPWHSYGRTLE